MPKSPADDGRREFPVSDTEIVRRKVKENTEYRRPRKMKNTGRDGEKP